jgi:spore germination protein KC
MTRQRTIFLLIIIPLFFATGCWDRAEIHDLSIVLAAGLDFKNEKYISSEQFVLPQKASGSSQGDGTSGGGTYFTRSGTGIDVYDAVRDSQAKVSGKIFLGSGSVFFFGESLARHGFSDIIDIFSRNPQVRLRSAAFIVKDGTAEEILDIPRPTDNIPGLGALKTQQALGGPGDLSFEYFMMDASTDGVSPTLPVVEVASSKKDFAYVGRAIFNKDMKLIGYLNRQEVQQTMWIRGLSTSDVLTGMVQQKGGGRVTVDVKKLGSEVHVTQIGNRLKIYVRLKAEGLLRENNTKLDLTQVKNLRVVENALDRDTEQQVRQLISKSQRDYRADIFAFGETFHESHPYRWKSIKNQWEDAFSRADISVGVDIKVRRVGLTGAPMYLNDRDIIK